MSLPSDLDNELTALRREHVKATPSDTLQFCANYFLKRLEAQRAEFHLQSAHSSKKGAPAMATSSFPGTNPFGGNAANADRGGMRNIQEEDDIMTPGSPRAPHPFRSIQPPVSPETSFGNFGSFGSFASGGGGGGGFQTQNKMPPMEGGSLPKDYNFNRRTSVSAESLNPTDANTDNWTPPTHPKTPEQEHRLRRAVSHNFIFSHLDEDQTNVVLGALVEKDVPAKGMRIISQGDIGDYFYIVERGNFDVYVSKTGQVEPGVDGQGTKVNTIGDGGSFGELALMYNAPRAATVTSTEPSTLWQLDRVTFRRILMDSAFNRRRMYESFLAEVPLLGTLTEYERSKIADALNTERHPAGHVIVKEGEPGDNFYLLEAGTAEVFKRAASGPIHHYVKGDYFGELALLNNEPRAASVVSSSDVKLATLGSDGFHRLLGPEVIETMRKNDPRQDSVSEDHE